MTVSAAQSSAPAPASSPQPRHASHVPRRMERRGWRVQRCYCILRIVVSRAFSASASERARRTAVSETREIDSSAWPRVCITISPRGCGACIRFKSILRAAARGKDRSRSLGVSPTSGFRSLGSGRPWSGHAYGTRQVCQPGALLVAAQLATARLPGPFSVLTKCAARGRERVGRELRAWRAAWPLAYTYPQRAAVDGVT